MTSARKQDSGVYAEFAPASHTPIGLRVGISLASVDNARRNLAATDGKTFDQIKTAAQREWEQHLNKITVVGGTPDQRTQFYTALYQTVLMPTDVTGDETWPSKEPHFEDIHAVWDVFRVTYPLNTLLHPNKQQEIVRSLLDIYKQKGWLPDYWRGNTYNIMQGGTNADVVIADAIVKNLGGFDKNLAYEAVLKNATVPGPDKGVEKVYPRVGRHKPYFTLGYVSAEPGYPAGSYNAPVSTTLEYAYNDFAVATVAKATGHTAEAEKYFARSQNSFNLFNPDTHFFWAKDADGKWMPDFTPEFITHSWNSPFYEGNAWHYRFYAPHDMQGLINRFGGPPQFVAALDEYFDGNHHNQGNEPDFMAPWLYIYAGQPGKTADRVHDIMATEYHTTPLGYAGDDDSGSMTAWYVFSALGFYPVAGQDVYLLGSPIFTQSTLKLGNGKTFTIVAQDLTTNNRYVQSATLNGKVWDKAWFRHGDIASGGKLIVQMGPKPSEWGTRLPPPSLTAAKTP